MQRLDETRKTRAARTRVGLWRVLVLWLALALGGTAHAAPRDGGMPLISGAFCGFVVPCTRVGEIGLHFFQMVTSRSSRWGPLPSRRFPGGAGKTAAQSAQLLFPSRRPDVII